MAGPRATSSRATSSACWPTARPRRNTRDGVRITSGPSGNTIGGTAAGAGNVISGNATNGVEINGASTTTTLVQGNFIGTDPTGTSAVPQPAADGVLDPRSAATNNTIGGTSRGQGNTIAFNVGKGVVVGAQCDRRQYGNAILRNSIFGNTALGIDLGNDGVTLNDSSGHAGPNLFQDFPVLTSAVTTSGGTRSRGRVHGPANSTIRVEFFSNPTADPSGYGQGQTFLGSVTVPTNGSGDGTFTFAAGSIASGSFISATATDANNNTSEFAKDLRVVTDVTSQLGFRAFAPDLQPLHGRLLQTITLTNTGSTTIVRADPARAPGPDPRVSLTTPPATTRPEIPTSRPRGGLAAGQSITIVLTFKKTSPGSVHRLHPPGLFGQLHPLIPCGPKARSLP